MVDVPARVPPLAVLAIIGARCVLRFARAERTFAQRIETNIDLERQKVVDDLCFAGAVARYALASRSGVPAQVTNATGDAMTTDGKVAVLVLFRP